jgi:hypothetical protein
MGDLMHMPQSRLLSATVLAVALLPMTVLPAAAVVRFEPTPRPTAIPQLPGGRIEVPWAGITVTFPEDWRVKLAAAPEPSLGAGASILTAFGPDATCLIDVYDPAQVDSWQDVGVEPDAHLTLAGVLVERFDRPWSEGLDGGSAYTVHASLVDYSLLCIAQQPPDDLWLSIVESIELFEPTILAADPEGADPEP